VGGTDLSLIVCDSNIFISLFRNVRHTVEELELIGSENVLIPSISVMELYRGMRNKNELIDMQKKIKQYNVLHFNEDVSKIAIELINNFRLSHNLQIPDAIIGAMAIVYDFKFFTYNTKDFKFMPGVQLYNAN
jgi:predicted nucleic acid-binding protein